MFPHRRRCFFQHRRNVFSKSCHRLLKIVLLTDFCKNSIDTSFKIGSIDVPAFESVFILFIMFALPYFPVHLRGFTLFFVSFLKFSCDSDRIECFTHFDPDHETFKYKILVKFVGQMDSASKVWLLMY